MNFGSNAILYPHNHVLDQVLFDLSNNKNQHHNNNALPVSMLLSMKPLNANSISGNNYASQQ